MINNYEQYILAKWIKRRLKTYGEAPKLCECIIWYKLKFEDKELSASDKNSIAHILTYNSVEQ
tara:strand:+ start:334 stop:522 length:189 start_codon:yes stop_codon:yes gene_type:complete